MSVVVRTAYMEHVKKQISQGIREELFPQYDTPVPGWLSCLHCNRTGDDNSYSNTPDPCVECKGRGIVGCKSCIDGPKVGSRECCYCNDGLIEHECFSEKCRMVPDEEGDDEHCIEDFDSCDDCRGYGTLPCDTCNSRNWYGD